MKKFRKILAFVLCLVMLATSMLSEGMLSLFETLRASAIADHEQKYNDARVELDFNKNWKFTLGDDSASYLKGFDDSKWDDVDLPHDFSIEQGFSETGTEAESGNIPGGTGWYRKWFNLYEYYTGDRVFLNFDGAYQHTYVYVNGQYVGENHYGYNSFSFEISDYLICSNTSLNLIAVKVVNDIPSSRWYSGSGINRDVTLTIAGPVHVSLYGPQITTPGIKNGDGTAKTDITMHNDTAISRKVTVEATVLDDELNAVSDTVTTSLITVPAETEKTVTLEPKVASPELWSIESPNLYTMKTVIKDENGELIDEYHTTFGYRYINWDADNGFSLNGELVKLKGVSLHHDQGALGAVQEYDAIYRQISILKDMGCNAIRTTHNTTSRVVIDICNELGMFVMEEFFDGWDASKNYNDHDFSEYFNQTVSADTDLIGANGQKWFEFVVEQTVLRDRHDPCIIAWGVGNELFNLTVENDESTANYENIIKSIVAITDKLDPERVLTQGNNKSHADATMLVDRYMDVIGGNYNPYQWSQLMGGTEDFRSSKPFVATEAASANNSRGVYYTMGKDDATLQCTAYDTYAVEWGTEAAEAWYYVATNDFFSGEFVWTGFDYIGETTPWMEYAGPNKNFVPNTSYFGIIDTAGFAKDSYYLYRSLWNEESTTLHLVPGSWNSENLYLDNGYVNVAVYSNAKKIELLLNGNVIATATSTVNTTTAGYTYKTWTESIVDSSNCAVGSFYTGAGEDFYPQFSVKYAEGELSVKAYDENNTEITDTVGLTKSVSGSATQIVAKTWQDKNTFVADGTNYIYVEFEARDADGNFMNDYNGTIKFKVDDQSSRYAKIVGVDNGNSASAEKFQEKSVLSSDSEAEFKMFNGRALVILKTTEEEGTINFTAVASDGSTSFSTNGVTVTSVKETGIELTDEFEEVITQNGEEYEVTLYDEYEMVKHHINELEAPKADGGSGDSDSSKILENFEIYQVDSTAVDQYIPDGEYVIFNQNYEYIEEQDITVAHDAVFSTNLHWGYALLGDTVQSALDAAAGSPYAYEKIYTDEANIFKFIHQGNNKYYIQNKSTGKYLKIGPDSDKFVFDTAPQEITVSVDSNGSVFFSHGDWGIIHYFGPDHFYAFNIPLNWVPNYTSNTSCKMWLYIPKYKDVETKTPEKYVLSLMESTVPDGEYVLNIKDAVMDDKVLDGWAMDVDKNITDPQWVSDLPYYYQSFNTGAENIYEFTNLGGNEYYIQNKSTGKYLCLEVVKTDEGTYWYLKLQSNPYVFKADVNENGSVLLHSEINGVPVYVFRDWDYFYIDTTQDGHNTSVWLYEPQYPESDGGDSGNTGGNTGVTPSYNVKKALYDILHEGIGYDYTAYTRTSYEVLLDALENGVAVYKKENATDAELSAATEAIRAAIDALNMDIKKINGTLFKYGYNNSTGAADYSSGGLLMNDIAVRQMKTAILADQNLVSQIKDIIGYDTTEWGGNRAEEVLNEVAEIYARIYTLMFTGKPQNDINIANSPSNYQPLSFDTKIPLSLWNIWTKDNTHGADDPVDWQGVPIHDGASVQGLASATLDDGVITSHTAYNQALSYANDGPTEMYDIEKHTYGFETGAGAYKQVTLQYLSGISVYFPDLFTRESLDASGNVTTATSGQYAKYYWDTEFPMFISTDEYGVNTYHYDSKDTKYLIQADFDDENHTAEMELNEVGKWTISGPNNATQSGFFPFNYKEGTTEYNGENAVYHYGFTFEHSFYIPKGGKHVNGEDVIFDFSGDDDVYVYIDGVLVLDNGGLHGARSATINFTDCSITYQYAMDVADGLLKGGEYTTTYSYNAYIEDPDSVNYNADTIAAINKLHEVITDGEVHTLNFFYLERGASDSNCKISFNLSETSEEVKIIDQNLTLDYGLPVEYNITENNNISQAALDNNVKIEYLGICGVNMDYTPTYTFEKPELLLTFEDGVTYTIEGMKYGVCTIDSKGNTTYTPTSTHMTKSENYFVVAKITGDPTYADDVVYYQVEKTTFIPATTIYYEDTFDTITYTNGKVPSNYDNSTTEYGLWKTLGLQETTLKQTADLTDSEANPYGYESGYSSFATYSGGSIHYTDVSTKNNPNKKYSGGTGAAWPTVDFTFTGTGFDLISITDNTTGAFNVLVKDDKNNTVWNTAVDTYYGYNYGRLYAKEDGNLTLDDSNITLYRTEKGTCTSEARYYDENGAITTVPHYYAEGDVVVETETDRPAYAYAYGWVVAPPDTTETLYQIPVIKITDLAYGSYSVTITPTFTSAFGHSSKDENGNPYYRVYLDAIKIYSPAGVGDAIADSDVKDAYAIDDELYPSYLEIKDMLIGADSLSETDTQGIIFIDGIAALDNDIATYKKAGPNNELYLAKDQAVAFEIWATSVPTDVQLGVKLACGNPDLTISYASKTTDMDITTATDTYHSFNTILPNDGKLTWRQVSGSDGNKYYTTGTVVIQNTGDVDSVLSITNLKWTFSQVGGKGYFRIPTPIVDENVTMTVTNETQAIAYSLVRMRTAALDVEQTEDTEIVKDEDGNTVVTVKLRTSADVASLAVTDVNGNPIDPSKYESVASPVEDEDAVEWTITFTENKGGDYTYLIAGVYENGYTDDSKSVSVSFTVENPPADEPGNEPDEPGNEPDEPGNEPDEPNDNPNNDPNGEPDDSDNNDSDYGIFDIIVYVFRLVVKIIIFVIGLLGINI